MTRRFITKQDIDACADQGGTVITLDGQVTVTDVAREHARARGIRLQLAAAGGGAAAATVDPGVSAEAVRTAVVAALGSAPAELDDVIRRVLARDAGTDDTSG